MTSYERSGSALANELPNTFGGLLWRMRGELTCPICLQMLSNTKRTPCGHNFCKECIEQALQSNLKTCPICKQGIHRRALVNASSIDLIVKDFMQLRSDYEKEFDQDLSLQVPIQTDWRNDPISNLSLKFPYPSKESMENKGTTDEEILSIERRQQHIVMLSNIPDENVKEYFKELMNRYPNNIREAKDISEMTCLVTTTDDNRLVINRTVKYLQAMLMEKSIVNQEWIIACYEQNQLVPTDAYQILGDTFTQQNIPKKIQEQHAQGNKLFNNREFWLYKDSFQENFKPDDFKSLITLAGGRVVLSPHEFSSLSQGEIICGTKMTTQESQTIFNMYGKRPIHCQWIASCIHLYQLKKVKKYIAGDKNNKNYYRED